jgi:hypothetical protein
VGSSPTGPTIVMSQDIGMTPEPTLSGFGVLGSSGGRLGLWPGCPLSPESSARSGWITYPCSSERPNERGSPLSAIAARRDAAAGSASSTRR